MPAYTRTVYTIFKNTFIIHQFHTCVLHFKRKSLTISAFANTLSTIHEFNKHLNVLTTSATREPLRFLVDAYLQEQMSRHQTTLLTYCGAQSVKTDRSATSSVELSRTSTYAQGFQQADAKPNNTNNASYLTARRLSANRHVSFRPKILTQFVQTHTAAAPQRKHPLFYDHICSKRLHAAARWSVRKHLR